MLNRQKSILSLLHQAGGEATRKQLVKWCFLVSRETATGGGAAYYDFVPFLYGPYSFALNHEIEKLVCAGLLRENGSGRWALTDTAKTLARSFPQASVRESQEILRRYGKMSEEALLDTVYDRYRWFTVNSKRAGKRLVEKPVFEPAIYTIGYEGKSVDAFLDGLLRHGVRILIDVRHHPIARRFGFHKSTLSRLCGYLGVEYVHEKELGIPSSLRHRLETRDDYVTLLARYEEEILPANRDALLRVADKMVEDASAVMCMEADPSICHRSRVAAALTALTGLDTIHLKGGKDAEVRENPCFHHRPDLSPSFA